MMMTKKRQPQNDATDEGGEYDRRGNDLGFWHRSVRPVTALLSVLSIPIVLAVMTWAFTKVPRLVTEQRFVADSTRRDRLADEDRRLLIRIDARLSDYFCGKLPPAEQSGCRR